MSEIFKWSEIYETGFGQIDEQHRGIVGLLNEAAPVLADPVLAGQDQVIALIDELCAHSSAHFADEEQLMIDGGLSPAFVDMHIGLHRGFFADVMAIRAGAETGAAYSIALLRFLTSWLTFHILGTDKAMARQLHLIESGVDAEEACRIAQAQNDPAANHALLGALRSLYQLLASRNCNLRDMNKLLEDKVTQQAEELAKAKHALAVLSGSTQQQ